MVARTGSRGAVPGRDPGSVPDVCPNERRSACDEPRRYLPAPAERVIRERPALARLLVLLASGGGRCGVARDTLCPTGAARSPRATWLLCRWRSPPRRPRDRRARRTAAFGACWKRASTRPSFDAKARRPAGRDGRPDHRGRRHTRDCQLRDQLDDWDSVLLICAVRACQVLRGEVGEGWSLCARVPMLISVRDSGWLPGSAT